jgi:hypothetical protein
MRVAGKIGTSATAAANDETVRLSGDTMRWEGAPELDGAGQFLVPSGDLAAAG